MVRVARSIVLLVLAGLLAGACASARVTAPTLPAASEPLAQTCADLALEEERTEVMRAGINTGLLAGAWGVLYGGAQGAFWGAISGTRDGAWIGAAVGAGVGLVLGVVQGVEAARQTRAQLAYAPPRCPREAVTAVIPPAKEEHAPETDPHTP